MELEMAEEGASRVSDPSGSSGHSALTCPPRGEEPLELLSGLRGGVARACTWHSFVLLR